MLLFMVYDYTDRYKFPPASKKEDPLETLMNGEIKEMIGIVPSNVTWGGKTLSHDAFLLHII